MGSGFVKCRSVLWALVSNPLPLASTGDQNLDLTSSHVALGTLWAGLLLPHRPWQMKPTHQNKEWLSTVPLCIKTASVNVILKMLQHYSDCKELVLFAITAKNGLRRARRRACSLTFLSHKWLRWPEACGRSIKDSNFSVYRR